jgi:hypothetical protein
LYTLLPFLVPSATREVLPPKHFLTIAPAITYAMGAMVALTLAFLLFNVVALLYYRKHKIIRFSQGNILQGKRGGKEVERNEMVELPYRRMYGTALYFFPPSDFPPSFSRQL